MPRARRGWRVPDHFLECRHVLLPVLTLAHVVSRELPVLVWLIQSFEEALLLLRARDIENELADLHAIVRQVAFEGANVLVPLAPDILGDELRRKPLAREDFGVHAAD